MKFNRSPNTNNKWDGLAPKENMMLCTTDQKGKVNISYYLRGDKLIVFPILDVGQAYDINSWEKLFWMTEIYKGILKKSMINF